jgi:hypothetical protein
MGDNYKRREVGRLKYRKERKRKKFNVASSTTHVV